jgi:hypothetical protein
VYAETAEYAEGRETLGRAELHLLRALAPTCRRAAHAVGDAVQVRFPRPESLVLLYYMALRLILSYSPHTTLHMIRYEGSLRRRLRCPFLWLRASISCIVWPPVQPHTSRFCGSSQRRPIRRYASKPEYIFLIFLQVPGGKVPHADAGSGHIRNPVGKHYIKCHI